MKLLIVIKNIDGGTGTYLLQLLKLHKYFTKEPLEIKTIVLEQPSYRNIGKKDFIYIHKDKYYPQKYSLMPKNLSTFVQEIFPIREHIQTYKPDVVLGVDIHCNLLILLSLLKVNMKKPIVILTTHINLSENIFARAKLPLSIVLKHVIKYMYNQADCIVCVSQKVMKDLVENLGVNSSQIKVIYNGIVPLKTSTRLKVKNKRFIMIGRHAEQKDFTTLLYAMKRVVESEPDAELSLLSDGPQKNEIQNLIKKLQLTNNVRLIGWVRSIDSYLKQSDIFVFSSKREGFGYVLIEAMRYALPVITTNTPYGPAEIVDNGKYGILVPMQDPIALSNAMLSLLTDNKMYYHYSQQSQKRVHFFSEDKMLRQYKELLETIIKKQ